MILVTPGSARHVPYQNPAKILASLRRRRKAVEETIKYLELLKGILGATATLADATDWLQVEENARQLREEGHENE